MIALRQQHQFAYALRDSALKAVAPLIQDAAPANTLPRFFPGHQAWWKPAVLFILVAWLYSSILERLAQQWWQDSNFSHGIFVPAFSLFLLWHDRERLRSQIDAPSWWGLALIVVALVTLILGTLGAELFLSRISLLLLIAGLIVLFFGFSHLRLLSFPLAFLILMVPIPAIIFNQITFPLQLLTSQIASTALPWFGVPVLREGNVIGLPAMTLEVAEACSGIRSLLSLLTLSIIYGYLMESRNSIRALLALASVPIAVAANSLRIVGTGLLVQYWDPEKAEGFFHAFSGWLIFVISLVMLFALHHGLARIQRKCARA
jgi:exosortase